MSQLLATLLWGNVSEYAGPTHNIGAPLLSDCHPRRSVQCVRYSQIAEAIPIDITKHGRIQRNVQVGSQQLYSSFIKNPGYAVAMDFSHCHVDFQVDPAIFSFAVTNIACAQTVNCAKTERRFRFEGKHRSVTSQRVPPSVADAYRNSRDCSKSVGATYVVFGGKHPKPDVPARHLCPMTGAGANLRWTDLEYRAVQNPDRS